METRFKSFDYFINIPRSKDLIQRLAITVSNSEAPDFYDNDDEPIPPDEPPAPTPTSPIGRGDEEPIPPDYDEEPIPPDFGKFLSVAFFPFCEITVVAQLTGMHTAQGIKLCCQVAKSYRWAPPVASL